MALDKEHGMVVKKWVEVAFGDKAAHDINERLTRILEEVFELVQAEGISEVDAIKTSVRLIAHVYGRPKGEPSQEIGGIGITLLAYCGLRGFDFDEFVGAELQRVLSLPLAHFIARQKKKKEAGISIGRDNLSGKEEGVVSPRLYGVREKTPLDSQARRLVVGSKVVSTEWLEWGQLHRGEVIEINDNIISVMLSPSNRVLHSASFLWTSVDDTKV